MKKSAFALVLTTVFLLFFSCGKTQEDKYTLKNFEEGMKVERTNPEDYYKFCLDFYNNTIDIDLLRNVTVTMKQFDKDKTLNLLNERSEKNPGDKVSLYLYARLLDNEIEKIKLGRKIIQLDTDWEYGYRLLIVSYMQHLFFKDNEIAETLKPYFPEDEKHFKDFLKFKTADEIQSIAYFKYLLYKQDPEVKDFAVKAAEKNEKWATDILLAEAYTFTEEFDKAYEYFYNNMKQYKDEMSEKDMMHNAALNIFYKLQEFGKLDQAHDYIMTKAEDLEEKDRYALSGMLYCKQKETKKGLSNIKKAAAMGYDNYFAFEKNIDFDLIKQNKEWPEIERVMKANYKANSGKRKDEALTSKFSKAAPASSFTDMNGQEITLESLKGSIVILDFWATWCGPCKMAMPVLSEFATKEIDGVKIFSVNIWEHDPEGVKNYFAEQNFKMDLVFGEKDSHTKFGFDGIPYICIIDKEGNIRYQENGFSNELGEKLEWWVEDLKDE